MFKKYLKYFPILKQLHQNKWLNIELEISRKQTLLAIKKINELILENNMLAINPARRTEPVVASLTSYGKRLNTVHHTIISLLNQSVQPEKLILWLAEDEFELKDLPLALRSLQKYGLQIRFCEDIRSYKKLLPTLKEGSQITVITFDDDVIYPEDQIARLLEAHLQFPEAIICHRAHKVLRRASGQILSYKNWQYDAIDKQPSFDLVPIGIGGVLYPANCFDEEVYNKEVYSQLCPTADDLWFKFMSLRAGRKVKVVDNPMPYSDYLQIPQLNQQSLWIINQTQNDVQLEKLLRYYPDLTFWP